MIRLNSPRSSQPLTGSTVVDSNFRSAVADGNKFRLAVRTFQMPRFGFEKISMFPDFEIHPVQVAIRMIFCKPEFVVIKPHPLQLGHWSTCTEGTSF